MQAVWAEKTSIGLLVIQKGIESCMRASRCSGMLSRLKTAGVTALLLLTLWASHAWLATCDLASTVYSDAYSNNMLRSPAKQPVLWTCLAYLQCCCFQLACGEHKQQ